MTSSPAATNTLGVADSLRARFDLACGYANEAFETNDNSSEGSERDLGDIHKAERHAVTLLRSLIRQRQKHGCHSNSTASEDPTCAFMRHLRSPAIVLLAGIWAFPGLGSKRPGSPDSPLGRVLKEDQRLATILNGVDRSHSALIKQLGDRPELDQPDLAYNLACYHTTVADFDTAIAALAVALADPKLRAWAPIDPSLAALRAQPAWSDLFPKGTSVAPPTLKELGLTELPIVLQLTPDAHTAERAGYVGSPPVGSELEAVVELELDRVSDSTVISVLVQTDYIDQVHAVTLAVGDKHSITPLRQRGITVLSGQTTLDVAVDQWPKLRVTLIVSIDQ